MKSIKSMLLVLTTALILHSTLALNMAQASDTTLSVKKDDATCTQSATSCFTSITSALEYANNIITSTTGTTATFSIQVEAGTYNESVTLGTGITSLRGRETARTILDGGGSGTLISVSGGNPIIFNLSFRNAQIGIAITNNATATIKNNIFNLGSSGTAVQLTQSTAQTSITNNTFYVNNIAISSSIDLPVKNNIFSSNTTALSPLTIFTTTNVTYNDFSPSNATDPLNGQVSDTHGNISSDPLFVEAANGDFHLKAGSPCINSGLDSSAIDMGVYGGLSADTIPFQVSGVASSLDTTTNIISVSWNANNSYLVTGYRVYYGSKSLDYTGTGATEGTSPISIPSAATTSATLSGLISSVTTTPASPTLNSVAPLNESLSLSWDAVDGATGYRIYYGTSSPPSTIIDVGDTTSYTLSGLTNGQTYFVAVSAIAQPTYYIAVTAIDNTGPYDPGIGHESAYSQESIVSVGSPMESGLSNILNDFPEALVAYPNLTSQGPSEHCFIATAAFGYYSAPEVQALREFRDRYLLTNSAGSAFVRWYYEHGPVAAAYIDAHPAYKPVVRAALMPAVGAALFMTRTSFFIKTVIALFILTIALTMAYRSSRKQLSGSGGSL